MPKIIDEAKSNILAEAKRQLLHDGYSGMTLRSVAEHCGIAVGTIYNYFSSKDVLIASFMLEDWELSLAKLKDGCINAVEPMDALHLVYDEIAEYCQKFAALFNDTEARRSAENYYLSRHVLIRTQIAEPLCEVCRGHSVSYTDFLPVFTAQAIITHAMEHRDFAELAEIFKLLFK